MAHDNADALNRFLDDLSHGAAVPDDELDPDLIDTVRWFRDIGAEHSALHTSLCWRTLPRKPGTGRVAAGRGPPAVRPGGGPGANPGGRDRGVSQ